VCRYAPGQTDDDALCDLRDELDRLEARFPGLKAQLHSEKESGRPTMPPFEVPKDSRIVQAVNAAYLAVRGTNQPTGAITPPGFYGTDAGHLYLRAGMEGVVCGPGGRYNTMPDERVDIADYLDMIRIYMRTIVDVCGIQ
jgi:acetylornithine deacetylase